MGLAVAIQMDPIHTINIDADSTFALALEFAAVLLAIDVLALRLISGMFDRERLITGAKAS